MNNDEAIATFFHPRNKRWGLARLIFAPGYGLQQSGWWAPGATAPITSEIEAERVAMEMDRLMKANAQFERTGFVGCERPASAAIT
jgi:hypothetical protein